MNAESSATYSQIARKKSINVYSWLQNDIFAQEGLGARTKNVRLTYYIECGEPDSEIIHCDTETLYCFDIVSALTGRSAGYEMRQIPAKMTFRKDKTASLLVEEWLVRQYQQQHREEQRRVRALLPRNPYTI